MSLLNRLKERLGSDGDESVTRRAVRGARERARSVDTQRARQATRRASESLAVEQGGRGRRQPARSREKRVAKRAEEAAAMQGPVDATLEPADAMGVDQLARSGVGAGEPEPRDRGNAPAVDDLVTGGGEDGEWLDFDDDPPDDDEGWL